MTEPVVEATRKEGSLITPVVIAVVAVVVTAYYAPFLHNFFDYDDFLYIENMYRGPLDILLGYGSFRLVSNLSWWPVFLLSGFDPFGYNLFSLGMLFLDAVAFYYLCRELLADLVAAALAAVLFAGGAAGADAVFWKSTSSTPICFFFYTLTLIFYLRWRRTAYGPLRVVSVALFVLAMLAKEEAASLPAIIILIEALFLGERKLVLLLRKAAPYAAVVALYLAVGPLFFQLVGREPEPGKFFLLRPLHTLLSPWTVFSLAPHGFLDPADPFLYLVPATLVAALFFIPQKKELAFALCWVFLTFVPQSFTSLGQTTPKYLFNSISRYLFLPSAGAALALALLVVWVGARWGRRIGICTAIAVVGGSLSINYARVQQRGGMWRDSAERGSIFLTTLKKTVPQFPPNTHVAIVGGPLGRAYAQQALRALYGNLDINWILHVSYRPKPGENAYLITCLWENEKKVHILVEDFTTGVSRLTGKTGG